ncbi:MAG: 2-succinyl-6-hydroxy-2,4-cyclohexadiene-1-carboxylate synthase [Elainellaceae cyanobacterium]
MASPKPFQFHYRQRGSGPVILFLHGFMGHDRDFDAVVECLQHRYTCLTLDLPDHGQTRLAADTYTMSTVADSLLDWLTQVTDQPCTLLGYSMGGRLALYLALTAPERFSHLVLESASPGLKTKAERQARIALDEARAQQIQQDFDDFLQRWYQAPMFRNLAQQPEFEAMLQRRRQNCPKALGRSLRCLGTGQQPNLWPHLHKLTMPTLLITGEQDKKFCAINAEMAQQIPNAERIIVSGCGHTVHTENSDRYAGAIAALA